MSLTQLSVVQLDLRHNDFSALRAKTADHFALSRSGDDCVAIKVYVVDVTDVKKSSYKAAPIRATA
ncbi:hypothetical protein [Pseudorhodoplanes sinuspersici]|uniref:hypothetical protein n=1 Tax=Pseudorhodoplanes sinuspersici TaxID=1235591 RepID=UPI0011C3DD04|nr:hypothetical protein [Pseudorhodoplanes sinuspersici]